MWDVVAEQGLYRLRGHRNAVTEKSFMTDFANQKIQSHGQSSCAENFLADLLDEVANAALFYGLMQRLPAVYGKVSERMPFGECAANFYNAASTGLRRPRRTGSAGRSPRTSGCRSCPWPRGCGAAAAR